MVSRRQRNSYLDDGIRTATNRRTVLRLLGAAAVTGSIGVGASSARPRTDYGLEKVGHSLLSNPPGAFAEGDIREDGQYGLAGSYFKGGSFLVDLSDPSQPTEVHRVPSSDDTRNADVKFDPRDGLYYRSQEPTADTGENGIEVIDYEFSAGTPENPEIIADVDNGSTHNVFPHPEVPILYATNEESEPGGIDVLDVSDPTNPTLLRKAGPKADLHDLVVDPEHELIHAAFIGGGLDGYVILDVSTPTKPTEIGRFDYAGRPDYVAVGTEGFENCHYADYDPRRGLAIIGDEVGTDVPGGKHIFDIGYGEGALENPIPIGFTHSPNAQLQERPDELFDWTTHNHDVVPRGRETLLASGDYHEGTVLYDITEPTNPTAVDRYATDDDLATANYATGTPAFPIGTPPMAWGADYNKKRDLVFTSDMGTGVYTFQVTPPRNQGRNR